MLSLNHTPHMKPQLSTPRRALPYVAALIALALVFLLYTRPDFLMTAVDQVWACF
jgi:hypothetical protein